MFVACHLDLGQVDSAFYNWDDRKVHCAVDIDSSADNSITSIESGLDRARDTGEVLELYAHEPGTTVTGARSSRCSRVRSRAGSRS